MNDWLRFLFGLEPGEIPASGDTHWELSNLPHGTWLGIASAIVLGSLVLILLLYIRERSLRPWQRATLGILRILALTLVILVLLNPRLLTEIRLEHPGKTIFLFDVSESMAQFDDFDGEEAIEIEDATDLNLETEPSRAEIAVTAIEREGVLNRLAQKNRLQLFTFGDELTQVSEIKTIDDVAPLAPETRLGDALLAATEQAGREPLAGVVVVSDGRSNAGESALAVAREIAARHSIAIHGLGIGRAQLPRNYALDELIVPSFAEVDTPIEIQARLRVTGMPGKLNVALYRSKRGERGRKLIETRQLVIHSQKFESQLNFVDRIGEKGGYRYSMSLPRDAAEIEWRDNRKFADVTVAAEKRRLLLVSGSATFEHLFVRNFALRDPGVQTSVWLSTADAGYPQDGDVVIDRLPSNAEELRDYDVVALLDPAAETLKSGFQEALIEFVRDQNGGLVYLAGEVNTPDIARDPELRQFRSLLPVDLEKAPTPTDTIYDEEWRGQLTARGRTHTVCRIVDDVDENLALWNRLPTFFFVYPATKMRASGVELARGKGGVLAAVQRIGISEVVYLGSDEFHRWRSAQVGYHERFWSSLLRYLSLSKLSSGTGRATVETDRDQYREGEQIRVVAHLVDARRRPIEKPRVSVTIRRTAAGETDDRRKDGGDESDGASSSTPANATQDNTASASGARDSSKEWTISLAPVPNSPGRYAGMVRTPSTGQFQASLETAEPTFFRVTGVLGERDDPSPDFALLRQLCDDTHGQFFTIGEIEGLADAIPPRREIEVLGRRAATIWDSAAMMCLFALLLSVEWILRKLWRLN